MKTTWLYAALALLVFLPGCLKREITYTIGPDESATVRFVARGDQADIEQGDLMPPKGLWEVKEYEDVKPDGNKEAVYEAKRTFARVADIAPNLATAGTRFPNAYLQTPIRFTMKDEQGAKVYEFVLTFGARRWKEYYDLLTQIAAERGIDINKLKDEKQMTQAEKTALFRVVARWQLRLDYDRIATALAKGAGAAALPAEKVQAILKRIDDAYDRIAEGEEIEKLMGLPDAERNAAFEEAIRRAHAEADAMLQEALSSNPYAQTLPKIRDDIAEATLEWEVTNDLGDENFTVKVEMPGSIVKSSADKVEGNRAEWNFNAEKFRDQDYVMSVTSRLAK
jgi:hypothetical protein